MPKRRIEIVLDESGGRDVEADFKDLYGGSDANWNWLLRQLETIDPVELKRLCKSLAACDLVKLPPCYVFGRLEIRDEAAWFEGLHVGLFVIEAVVHESHATAYYEAQLARVPASEQDV